MDEPFFSVIVPTFNRAKYVRSAIKSILDQSFGDFELIVVDDGSTDDTASVVADFGDRLQIIRQGNSGVSAARNRGAWASRGRWLAFLDSDDVWRKNYLERQRDHLSISTSVVMQCADCCIHLADHKRMRYFQLNGTERAMDGRASIVLDRACAFVVGHSPWQMGSTIVSSEVFRKAKGFDESLAISEDLDLIARISLLGPARFVPDCLVDVFRRREPFDSLSQAADRMPLEKRLVHETIYSNLKDRPDLVRSERTALARARGANRRAIGRLRLIDGKPWAAMQSYLAALCNSPWPRG